MKNPTTERNSHRKPTRQRKTTIFELSALSEIYVAQIEDLRNHFTPRALEVIMTLPADILQSLHEALPQDRLRSQQESQENRAKATLDETVPRFTITCKQAARILKISPATTNRWRQMGYLNAVVMGPRTIRYSKEEVKALAKELQEYKSECRSMGLAARPLEYLSTRK